MEEVCRKDMCTVQDMRLADDYLENYKVSLAYVVIPEVRIVPCIVPKEQMTKMDMGVSTILWVWNGQEP